MASLTTSPLPLHEDALREFCKALPRIVGSSEEAELRRDYSVVLDKLVGTAYDPAISLGHRGVAINALCSFIGIAEALSILKPLDQTSWFACVDILLDRPEGAKTKPLRQLLVCLTTSLSEFSDDEKQCIIDRLVRSILSILQRQSDHVKAKPALQILNHLLVKDVLTTTTLRALSASTRPPGHTRTSDADDLLVASQQLLLTVLNWAKYSETTIAVGQAIRTLAQKLSNDGEGGTSGGEPIWAKPLLAVLYSDADEVNSYRSHILPELFKLRVDDYFTFLNMLGLRKIFSHDSGNDSSHDRSHDIDSTEDVLLFSCLEVGKESGLVLESSTSDLRLQDGVLYIPETMLAQLLQDAEDSIRLSGLALMITSVSVTKPFTSFALRCVKRNLSHLFMETDVHVRGEMLVHIQRLVDRIKAASGPLSRSAEKMKKTQPQKPKLTQDKLVHNHFEQLLSEHHNFLRYLLKLAKAQLHPAAAYQRHIAGLRTLIILAKSGLDGRLPHDQLSKQAQAKEAARWPFAEPTFDSALTRMLQDLLMDPFEDVRNFASTLLVMQASIPEPGNGLAYSKFTKRAEVMMLASGRADHADGVSRGNAIAFEAAYVLEYGNGGKISREDLVESLLNRLEQRLLLAKSNMSKAVAQSPLHGALASLRLIFDNQACYKNIHADEHNIWRAFHARLITALHGVWFTVRGVLCNDAPEGYVPEDMEEEISISTKDILSYCWRALREASLLLRVLVLKTPIGDSDTSLLLQPDFDKLCRLAFIELSELRHRGAFSAVAQAFAASCSRASTLCRSDLLDDLFLETMRSIRTKGSATTRRSAGLPSLVVGILSASPQSPLFQRAMDVLLDEAAVATREGVKYGDSIPQVHALNCLRSIFINTVLGQYTEPYIARSLVLAGKCLTSDIWAIRNCGLMLFRALIDRLLGSADSQNWSDDTITPSTARISYDDFPELLDIVLNLLRPGADQLSMATSALESVFPALKLIQRIPPPSTRRDEVRELILRLCGSSHWHVRDMAARTYATLAPPADSMGLAMALLPNLKLSQNLVHGRLLCILWLVKLHLHTADRGLVKLDDLYHVLLDGSTELDINNPCPFTRSAYLDILNIIGLHKLGQGLKPLVHIVLSRNDITQILQAQPSVRHSRALHLCIGHLSQEVEQEAPPTLQGYLLELQEADLQTALQMVETLIDNAKSLPARGLRVIGQHLSLLSTYAAGRNLQLLSLARSLLVRVAHVVGDTQSNFTSGPTLQDMAETFSSLVAPSPSLVENTVLLWGSLINEAVKEKVEDSELQQNLDTLGLVLRRLIHEDQPFDLRIAAARCLRNMTLVWTASVANAKGPTKTLFKLHMLVYDSLNDDDEDIRTIAADVAAIIVSSHRGEDAASTPRSSRHVPLVSSQRLIAFMMENHSRLPDFVEEAINRITGGTSQILSSSQLTAAATNQNALFAVEKQNLFIDLVREAELWSQALRIVPLEAILCSSSLREKVRELTKWARMGLDLILEKLRGDGGVDGVLGWTSKADTFVFGMRLWCVVDILFRWRQGAERKSDKLLGELVEILRLCQLHELHPLWLAKTESVITRELRQRMEAGEARRNISTLTSAIRRTSSYLASDGAHRN